MSHHISNEMAVKIATAQKEVLSQAHQRAYNEWNYLIHEFKKELHSQFENILKEPFNNYVKIPVKDDFNEKHYTEKLSDLYFREFSHVIQITDGYYYILLTSPHFHSQDSRPRPVSKISTDIEPEKSYVFSELDKKRFEKAERVEEELKTPRVSSNTGEKKPSLLRRPSRMSLPTISARRGQDLSITETETSLTQ